MNSSLSNQVSSIGIFSHFINDLKQLINRMPKSFLIGIFIIIKAIIINTGIIIVLFGKLLKRRNRRIFIRNLKPIVISSIDNFFQ